jgi:hypothetical protein
MRPGQLTLNEFEAEIFRHFVKMLPSLSDVVPKLHVLSREFTGVGSYTNFLEGAVVPNAPRVLLIDAPIKVPGLKLGLDALLFFEKSNVNFLELVAFG